jgi:hypothetical protein
MILLYDLPLILLLSDVDQLIDLLFEDAIMILFVSSS